MLNTDKGGAGIFMQAFYHWAPPQPSMKLESYLILWTDIIDSLGSWRTDISERKCKNEYKNESFIDLKKKWHPKH